MYFYDEYYLIMITFLKIILFFILFSFLLRLLSPLILSYFIKRFQNNIKTKFENMNENGFNNQDKTTKSKVKKEEVGEYVDFEELD